MDKIIKMYNKLIELTNKGVLTKIDSTIANSEDFLIIRNGKSFKVEKGIWKEERFFKDKIPVADRKLIYLSDGSLYEDELLTYNNLDKLL